MVVVGSCFAAAVVVGSLVAALGFAVVLARHP